MGWFKGTEECGGQHCMSHCRFGHNPRGWPLMVAAVVILPLGLCVFASEIDARKDRATWKRFSNDHDCKAVEVDVPHAHNKTRYLCSDGVSYWR